MKRARQWRRSFRLFSGACIILSLALLLGLYPAFRLAIGLSTRLWIVHEHVGSQKSMDMVPAKAAARSLIEGNANALEREIAGWTG